MKKYKPRLYQFFKHPLFSGSLTMIVGSNFANFIAYIYHLVIGRLLGPIYYGELSAVLSILGLIFSTLNFLGLVVVKFVSEANKKDLPGIYAWFTKRSTFLGLFLSLIILLLTPFLSKFLQIELTTFLLVVPLLCFSVTSFVYRSFLQGLMRFREVVIAVNLDFVARIIFSLIFIYLGLFSFGAVLGIVLSMAISFLLLRHFLKSYRLSNGGSSFDKVKEVVSYSMPIFFATVATNSFFSTDVILVKHFFNSYDAGLYASLSTLGKIIFFGAGPVGAVMFPMIAERHAKKQNTKKIFLLSLLFTLTISLGVLLVYWLFPNIAIKILYGERFIEGAKYLFPMGIFMTIFTFNSLFLNYFLSRNQTKAVISVVFASLIQGIGIFFFHKNIYNVISVSIFASLIFLFYLLIYFCYEIWKESKKAS